MASLSGSLLWVDSARSNNGAPPPTAVAAREAVPRPPRVDEDCDEVPEAKPAAKSTPAPEYCEDACPYAVRSYTACPYRQCPAEEFLQSDCDFACPADLPQTTTEASAEVVSEAHESEVDGDAASASESQCLSQYDPLYDAEVYGVTAADENEAVTESEASESASDLCYENYDYQAYSEDFAEEAAEPAPDGLDAPEPQIEDRPELYGYEYEYDYEYDYDDEAASDSGGDKGLEEDAGSSSASEAAEAYGYEYEYEYEDAGLAADDASSAMAEPAENTVSEAAEAPNGGIGTYEYENDYDYHYEYEYDYEDATPGEQGAPAADKPEWVEATDSPAPAIADHSDKGDFGSVAAHLRKFASNAIQRCEPVRAALEAGCKIVAWSSGVDPVLALEAATAEIADRSQAEENLHTR
jgi:hypothetical protein